MTLLSQTRAGNGVRAAWLSLALVACMPLAHADTPIAGDDTDALALDAKIQQLKKAALDVNRDALAAERDYLYPVYTRLAIGVSVNISALLIHHLTVRIDDQEPIQVVFDNAESIALLKSKGIYPVARLNLANGEHRISAQFDATYADSKPADPPVSGQIDQRFKKDEHLTTVELQLGHGAPFSKPELVLKTWSAPQ